jgi:hypothetical protein
MINAIWKMNDWFQTLFRSRFLPAYIPILMSVMDSQDYILDTDDLRPDRQSKQNDNLSSF